MNQRASTPGERIPLLITIGVFVVMLACVPVAWALDRGLDEDRPMYVDMLRMQNMQTGLIANKERPVEATVSDGGTVEIGAHKFTASAGVTVVVRVVDKNSFCVRASNDQGLESEERCTE